ncbi:MAG: kelch repeat-containing protein [Gemmataceae bacterium]
MRRCALFAFVFCPALALAQDANRWRRLDDAAILGARSDIPLGYAAGLKRFIVLGGRTSWGDYKKPRSYDVLQLDLKEGRWENAFPAGKDWGPRFGAATAPAWKSEAFGLRDVEGNLRPNWTVYGTFSLGRKFDYDPDTDTFLMYLGGYTLRYDPAKRAWSDLAPPTHPEKELGGVLLWSSLCYDRHNKRFVLFGGGNVETERGAPGTWVYEPKANVWKRLDLEVQPPPRANSRLVYDPLAKKVVLFGGDQLDQLVADTWTFDVTRDRWEELRTERAPAPRAGHALLWLPKAKKVLLLGGYTYTSTTEYVASLYQPLPLEAWTLDIARGRWDLVGHWPEKGGPVSERNRFLPAAVDDDDRVLILSNNTPWLCPIDAAKSDEAAAKKLGVGPGAVVRRTGSHDPAWYRDAPPADPKALAAELKDLPANTWVRRKTPKRPGMNMDWGSAVFAPELDLILRFSGGHSAYSGTAPQVYDVRTDRWRLPFAPEYPIDFVYSNDQVHGEWSFKGNPWMTGHTYKSTGYDPKVRGLVFAAHNYTFVFDPAKDRWRRAEKKSPFTADFYNTTLCATPAGVVAWGTKRGGGPGLWRLDGKTLAWIPLPLKGELPQRSPDRHGMAYDRKRDRLLFLSDVGKEKGKIAAYDFKTGAATWLDVAPLPVSFREAIYVDHLDAVLVGAHIKGADGRTLWPFFDCAANAWQGIVLDGDDPVGKKAFNNSLGLMYDPGRRLVWGVGQHSEVFVLRFDASGLRRLDVK